MEDIHYNLVVVGRTEAPRIKLLFLATPHEVSRALVPEAIANGMRVVDLSGAWRLREAQNRAVYAFHDENAVTAADLMEKAVYGLPELNGDKLPNAALVANPGCYATSVILALAPLLAADIVDRKRESFPIRSPVSQAQARKPRRAPTLFRSRTTCLRIRSSDIAMSEKF